MDDNFVIRKQRSK